jgi:ATP-dependent exoDNAse (exonuclease V) beta subunit
MQSTFQDLLDRQAHIDFDKEKHVYSVSGSEYMSVTTFVNNVVFKPFDEQAIATWCSRNTRSKYYGMDKKNIVAEWKAAADKGTQMHDAIDRYLNEEKDAEWPEKQALLSFLNSHPTWRYVIGEKRLFDKEYKLAGTFDAVFVDGDEYILVDWKRTGKPISTASRSHSLVGKIPDCNFYRYSLQLNIYRAMIGPVIKRMYIVRFTKDDYEKLEVDVMDLEEILAHRKNTLE